MSKPVAVQGIGEKNSLLPYLDQKTNANYLTILFSLKESYFIENPSSSHQLTAAEKEMQAEENILNIQSKKGYYI